MRYSSPHAASAREKCSAAINISFLSPSEHRRCYLRKEISWRTKVFPRGGVLLVILPVSQSRNSPHLRWIIGRSSVAVPSRRHYWKITCHPCELDTLLSYNYFLGTSPGTLRRYLLSTVKVKVKQFRYRPRVAQRVPGS